MIRQGPLNQTVSVDSTVVLGCQTTGSPPPTVQWKKDAVALSLVDSRMSMADTGSLEIRYAKVRDEEMQQFGLTETTLSQGFALMYVFILLSLEIRVSTLVLPPVPAERPPGPHTCK